MTGPTFASFDAFNRKPFADRLTKAITAFYPFTDGAYVLGLNARFGSGKTTFLRMWQHDLCSQDYKVIYLNAWDTDFDEDPIIAIASALLEEISPETNTEKVRSALKGVLCAASVMANQAVAGLTGVNIHETMDAVKTSLEESDQKSIGEKIYQQYEFKKKSYAELKRKLTEYANELDAKPLIIMVDELDRVRPNYAIRFLEAIKHIFSVPGICFGECLKRHRLWYEVAQEGKTHGSDQLQALW